MPFNIINKINPSNKDDQQNVIRNTTSSIKPLQKMANSSIVLSLIISLVAGFSGGWVASRSNSKNSQKTDISQAQKIVLNESQLISDIAKNVGPSVVSVNVISESVSTNFFGFASPVQQESAGTGVIISADGVIITNRHVVPKGSSKVSVTLSDGTEIKNVEVLGRTNDGDSLDIAFLKIKDLQGKKLKAAKLGESGKMQVGDKVVAIGNALGQFQNTVTSGIISGFGRSIQASDDQGLAVETLQNLFQTDAAINQGNSGGPLVNLNGEVIGINSAIAGGRSQNVGFAIPIDDIRGLVKSVLEKGKLLRPYLGVRYVSLTDDYAYQFNLTVKRGAYIAPQADGSDSVLKNSPASKAGLKEKDVIVKADGVAINDKNSLSSILGKRSVGEEVQLVINREGKEINFTVRLEAAPSE